MSRSLKGSGRLAAAAENMVGAAILIARKIANVMHNNGELK